MTEPEVPTPLRLAAIVPHTIARRGMEAVFDATPEIDLLQMGVEVGDLDGFAPDAFDAVLVVVTVQSGYDGVRALSSAGHRVVVMGAPEHERHALAAGAKTFVHGESEPDALVWALVHGSTDGPGAPDEPSRAIRLAVVVSNPLGQSVFPPLFDGTRCHVVATVTRPEELEQAAAFDVMIVGLGPRHDDAKARIAAAVAFGVPVLCLATTEYRETALAAGVQGFMRGAETPDEIIRAVEVISEGGTCFPESRASLAAVLSARERQVVEHLARGCTDREIGDRLGISMRTVQSHLDRIREKTGRRRRAELTRLAMELGIAADVD